MAFSKPKAHERAERYAAKGQHDKAAREYQSIVEHDPKDVRAWLMWADCLVRCGDKPGAIERYVRVAQYYAEAKEHNKALAVYRQVLNLDNQRLDIQIKVAQLNLQVGHTQDAIAIYERVAHAQLQAGRVADALATYKVVADADPTAVPRRLRLAELYSREKRTADAVEAFRAAGQQLRLLGRPEDYVRVAERLLYHDDEDLPTVRELARVYLELGEPRRALLKLNGLLRSNAKDEEGIELLAETFMALGKPEKALSALEELARGLRARGPTARADAIRILRRGLEWRPAHAEFREALAELEGKRRAGEPVPAAARPGPEPLDEHELAIEHVEEVDDDDLVELDDDDLVVEEIEPSVPSSIELPGAASSAPGTRRTVEVEALPSSEPSLTQSVLSEVEADVAMPTAEGLTDFDKILFEAKVYIKYRLFEHALDHVQTALRQQPRHLGALELQAQALGELGRTAEAAEAHLVITELVMPGDPKLAREHLEAARTLAPDHPRAHALARVLGASQPQPQPPTQTQPITMLRPATPGRGPVEDDGDSGAFDVVTGFDDDDGSPPGVALDLAGEPAANLVSAHEDGEYSTQPFTPIAAAEEAPAPARRPSSFAEDNPAQTGRTLLHYPPLDRPPRPEPMQPSASVEDLDDALAPEGTSFHELELDAPVTSPAVTTHAEPPGPDPAVQEDEPMPAPPPEAGDWPDLGDELDEIRFYVDQGLDDDAEAALDDLERQYPGHPQIARFRGKEPAAPEPRPAAPEPKPRPEPVVEARPAPKPAPRPMPRPEARPARPMPRPAPPPEPEPELIAEPSSSVPEVLDDDDVESLVTFDDDDVADEPLVSLEPDDGAAAAPLVSFDDDEDDEDAYLSAIFADPVKPKAKPRTDDSTPGAKVSEGQAVDAATAFDLGVAYREMGLVDAAITQFETAARAPEWRARALTLLGALRLHRGETDQAITDLQEAVQLATTPAEASEAAYELGVLYEVIGDTEAAIQQLLTVAPGYRDRDARLADLGF